MNSGEELAKIAESVCEVEDVELYWLDYHQGGGHAVVRVFIDRAAGVTIDDCERVSRALEPRFDELIPHRYLLEVSSPGIERELHTKEHFRRAVGELIRVKLRHPLEGRWVIVGRLIEVEPEPRLKTDDGLLTLPWKELTRAQVLSPPEILGRVAR